MARARQPGSALERGFRARVRWGPPSGIAVREAAARYLGIRPSDFLKVRARDRRGGWTSAGVARADVEYFGHESRGSINCRTAQDFAPTGAQEPGRRCLPARFELCGRYTPERLPGHPLVSYCR